MRMSRAPA